ncbi:DctP family TRAP transporter solute-binding subunit [Rhodoferax ferrireducens]|uniref:DctP family TRAP transporter solute-binding subunit n=1 Tax=Rhodoferax ferrireducens TaxID=192843 RepID=UPI000E0D108F|nr:DctP family TRAP transporter solute-binding subunit [Rhodoferax ferrireducens]
MKHLYELIMGITLVTSLVVSHAQTTSKPAAVASTVVLRLSHVGSTTSSQHLAALRMAETASELSQGTLRIDVFPNSELGNDAKSIADVKAGTLDMTMAGSGNFVSLAPRLAEIDLPYSFQTPKEAWHELDSPYFGRPLLNETLAAGIRGLSFWEVGFRIITSNKGFVKTPADFKGLRLRVGNATQAEYFRALGAHTISMPLGELYEAIKADKLDAQDHPLSITYSEKLYEVQKYVTITRHAYTALMVAINAKRFNALSPAHQKALLDAAVAGRDFQRSMNAKTEASMIADLRSKRMEVFENIESRPFRVLAITQSSRYFSNRLSGPTKPVNPTTATVTR